MIKRLLIVAAIPVFLVILAITRPTSADTSGPPRGVIGDGWADVVLGKPDFTGLAPNEVTAARVFNGGGVIVDRSVSPNRLYVYDGANSRVLGMDHLGVCSAGTNQGAECTADSDCPASACAIQDGRGADLVIGQPDFSSSGCNGDSNFQDYPNRAPASASTLCGLWEQQVSPLEGGSGANMALDSAGNLYVPDWDNNRVLLYYSPFTTDTIADDVWGQEDFSGNACNEGRGLSHSDQSSLCLRSIYNEGFVGGVGLDAENNLWITDNQNNRVLRFTYDPATGRAGHDADLVLGQPNFTSGQRGSTLDHMWAPAAVRVDSAGSVYVADSLNGRILIFDPPLASGMSATRQLGEDLDLHEPVGIEFDLDGNIWVNDRSNFQLLRFNPEGVVDRVLFKDVPNYTKKCGGSYTGDGPRFYFPGTKTSIDSWNMCDSMGSLGIDSDGNLFVYTMNSWQDVWRFPAPFPTPTVGKAHSADHQIFKPYTMHEFNHTSPNAMISPRGIVTESGQLIVSDMGRILFWNRAPADLSDGLPADGYVGAPNFNTHTSPNYNKLDADGQFHMYATQGDDIEVFNLPLTSGDKPFQYIGNPLNVLSGETTNFILTASTDEEETDSDSTNSFVQSFYNYSTNSIEDATMWGAKLETGDIAATKDGKYLWISDSENSRILRVRDPLTNPTVDVVIGQPDISSNQCNQGLSAPTARTLCYPGHISIDNDGNLYVADHSLEARGNRRLLEYDVSNFPDQPNHVIYSVSANRVYGTGGSFTRATCTTPDCGPWEPAFDKDGKMYLGYNGYLGSRFALIYDSPLTNQTPTGALNDYFSMGFTTYFDRYGTLYVGDLNRGRVLVYFFDQPQQGYTVSGKLVNQKGYGVPNGQIQVEHYIWKATSDSQGNFALQKVTPGDYNFVSSQGKCTFNSLQNAVHVTGDMGNQNIQGDCYYTISGKVMDGAAPLAGVVVSTQTGQSVTTGADGVFTLAGLPPDTYTLSVSKNEYYFSQASLAANLTNQDLQGITFSGEPSEYHEVGGKIMEGSAPLPGVTLSIAPEITATSDENGDYLFSNLTQGSYTITPQLTGYTFSPPTQGVTVSHQDIDTVDFSAELTKYDISGKVMDGATPLSGVLLTIAPDITATTDASGNYCFTGLLPGNYTLTPAKAGYAFTPLSRSLTISTQNLQNINFSGALIRYSISGKITDGTTPLAGVLLTITPDVTATSDGDGNYHFSGLLPGDYSITPAKTGFIFTPLSRSVTISDQNLQNINFSGAMIRYNVSGKITDGTTPLAGVSLAIAPDITATSDVNGNYLFSSLLPGDYSITPAKAGYTFTPSSRSITLSDQNLQNVDFSGALVCYDISGKITNGTTPLAGVLLTIAPDVTATSDADGNYLFASLVPGDYTITLLKAGYTFTPESRAVTISNQNLQNVDFSGELVRYNVSGKIMDGATPLAGVLLTIAPGITATSDANGNYLFSGLLAGQYTITPVFAGYTFTPATQAITISDQGLQNVNFTGIRDPIKVFLPLVVMPNR